MTRISNGYGLNVNPSRAPGAAGTLPSEIAGVPVRIEVVGPIHKSK